MTSPQPPQQPQFRISNQRKRELTETQISVIYKALVKADTIFRSQNAGNTMAGIAEALKIMEALWNVPAKRWETDPPDAK